MRTIHKYAIPQYAMFQVPEGFKTVHVDNQYELVTVWIEIDTDVTELVTVEWFIVGTGHIIPDGTEHVGTCLAHHGEFVWHIYERRS
jgi:hypothetical protein